MEQNVNTSAPMALVANEDRKSGKGLKIVTALACIAAVCGIGFGVYGVSGMFFYENTSAEACVLQLDDSSRISQKELPSIETLTNLLRDKYGLFYGQDNYTNIVGTVLSDYVYDKDGINVDAGKLFLLIRPEFPSPDCGGTRIDARCYRVVAYDDLNDKYHEYYGNSEDIKKGINYIAKSPLIGVESIKYIEGSDSFDITYPTAIGGVASSAGYYTNIVSVVRTDDVSIVATAIVTMLDTRNAKLYGWGGWNCSDVNDCPNILMNSLTVESALYKYFFIEEDGSYKLTDIVKQ